MRTLEELLEEQRSYISDLKVDRKRIRSLEVGKDFRERRDAILRAGRLLMRESNTWDEYLDIIGPLYPTIYASLKTCWGSDRYDSDVATGSRSKRTPRAYFIVDPHWAEGRWTFGIAHVVGNYYAPNLAFSDTLMAPFGIEKGCVVVSGMGQRNVLVLGGTEIPVITSMEILSK